MNPRSAIPPMIAIGVIHSRNPPGGGLRPFFFVTRGPAYYGTFRGIWYGPAIMSDSPLEERERALENQFFDAENKHKLSDLKEKLDTQKSKDDLRKASGMTDDTVLEK